MIEADLKYLKEMIETLAKITEPCEEGILRRSYTPEYREGIRYVSGEMTRAGLTVREDTVGNLFGTLSGTETGLPVLMSGSHLDSVRCAGAFDGIAGVVCALEAARMIQKSGEPLRHPYTVAGIIGEEGTRFGQVLLGSRFLTGDIEESQLDFIKDLENGKTLRKVMEEYGLRGDIKEASLIGQPVKAFVELHGEQGPVLEQAKKEIGIVETIAGIAWLEVTVIGQANHSGTVPMKLRKDAGITAYQMILKLQEYILKYYSERATMTVGQLKLEPGSSNCIPGKAVFTLDFRSGDAAALADLQEKLQKEAEEKMKEGYQISVRLFSRKEPVPMHSEIQKIIQQSCKKLGYSYQYLNSGAGHDSMIFASCWPTAMLFLPNKDGISHNPREFISYEDMKKGAEVLYQTIRQLDGLDDVDETSV